MQTVNGFSHDNKVSLVPQLLQPWGGGLRGTNDNSSSLRLLPDECTNSSSSSPMLCTNSSPMLPSQARGTYVSALGGLPLFSSQTKFNSGTG